MSESAFTLLNLSEVETPLDSSAPPTVTSRKEDLRKAISARMRLSQGVCSPASPRSVSALSMKPANEATDGGKLSLSRKKSPEAVPSSAVPAGPAAIPCLRQRAASVLSARGSVMSTARAGGSSTTLASPKSDMPVVGRTPVPSTSYAQFPLDTAKRLRTIQAKKQEAVVLRVMPKSHSLQQMLLDEASKREVLGLEQNLAYVKIVNAFKAETLKKRQKEQLEMQKETVKQNAAEIEGECRQSLRRLNLLQPRNKVCTAVLSELKKEDGDLELFGHLLEEDKKLVKGLKQDAKFDASKTASTDGGSLTFKMKRLLAASFNAAAILDGSEVRASVEDVTTIPSKLPAEKRALVLRNEDDEAVLEWFQVRALEVEEAIEQALALAERVDEVSPEVLGGAKHSILWSKANLTAIAKTKTEDAAKVSKISSSVLSFDGCSSISVSEKEVSDVMEDL